MPFNTERRASSYLSFLIFKQLIIIIPCFGKKCYHFTSKFYIPIDNLTPWKHQVGHLIFNWKLEISILQLNEH